MEDAGFEPSLGGFAGAELPLPAGALTELMVRKKKSWLDFTWNSIRFVSEAFETKFIGNTYVGLVVPVVVADVAVGAAMPEVETGVAATVLFAPGGVVPSLATTWKAPLVLVVAVPASVKEKKYFPGSTSTVHANAFGCNGTAALMSLGVLVPEFVIINWPLFAGGPA